MIPFKFFADHCVPRSVTRRLQNAGYKVIELRQCLATDAPDDRVLQKAQELDAILLSLDGDFADIVTYPPAEYCGIVALQVRNHPETIPSICETLIDFLERINDPDALNGRLLTVRPHQIRLRQ